MKSSTCLFPVAAIAALLLLNSAGRSQETSSQFQRPATVSPELTIGDLMPDVPLRDDNGEVFQLRDFHGRTVAITFFYSRCTEATFCPLVGRKFGAAQELLTRAGATKRCHLLSISLDSERDTPQMLSAYARGYQADSGLWTFAAGSEDAIRKLGDAVGLEFKRVGERIDHNLRTVILDASGRIRRIIRGDNWTPQELVADLNATARRYP